ncbi:NADPH-dependent 2,4-dienoyl-CoA reductase, partial [Marivirga lumbricoides]
MCAASNKKTQACGVNPRDPKIEGQENEKVLSYIEVLKEGKAVGERVAIIGAGGIGFDVAEFISQKGESASLDTAEFLKEWGIDAAISARGGVNNVKAQPEKSPREITMFQRSEGKMGARLGKTTGWIHRAALKNRKVNMVTNVQYDKIDEKGLHYTRNGKQELLEVDTIILCAGQVSEKSLFQPLSDMGIPVHLIGGSAVAA